MEPVKAWAIVDHGILDAGAITERLSVFKSKRQASTLNKLYYVNAKVIQVEIREVKAQENSGVVDSRIRVGPPTPKRKPANRLKSLKAVRKRLEALVKRKAKP